VSAYTKPYTNRAGVTITSAAHLSMDEGLNWYAICEKHNTLVGDTNRRRLSPIASTEFCDCCRLTCVEGGFQDTCSDCGRGRGEEATK
jgi:hypothetical protein